MLHVYLELSISAQLSISNFNLLHNKVVKSFCKSKNTVKQRLEVHKYGRTDAQVLDFAAFEFN